jgi:hypothetical protein
VRLSTGRKPLCTFYYQATPATSYWRTELPAKYLPGKLHPAPGLSVVNRGEDKPLEFPDVVNDTAVMQFPGDQGSAVVALAMKATGKRFLVEVDDNYLDQGDPLWRKRSNWGSKIGATAHTVQGHRWIVENSHGVIVTTRALAAYYGDHNDNVHVCRNSIDPDDWPEPTERDEAFRIGWYASQSHDRDEVMVRKALAWASRQPNVEIVNIGLDPGWPISRRWIGWKDNFKALRPELGKLDIGVAPLVGTPMTRFRSDLKALEYAMGGAMPFVQTDEPYHEWRDVDYSKSCATPAEWMDAIQWGVRNRDEVRAKARQAREHVLVNRTFRTEIERWRQAIA